MPYVFSTRPGQFEIVSVEEKSARVGIALAEEVWRTLQNLLFLPTDGFPAPITVRLYPQARWQGEAPFASAAEAGSIVSARVRWTDDEAGRSTLRRALVQTLLMRRAISIRGLVPGLAVPLWLENGCIAWSISRERPGTLDRWQRESAGITPPLLATVLTQRRGAPVARENELGALWLITYLQNNSGPEQRWLRLVRDVLGGTDSAATLGQAYGELFSNAAARELWWQVGWHAQLHLAAQAGDSAAETRVWLAERARWTGRRVKDGDDQPLSLDDVFAARTVPWIAEELGVRLTHLRAGLATAHPFYRNAVLSLGRLYEATLTSDLRGFTQAQTDLARDIADGRELEQATTTALDELEATAVKPLSS
jgi:hypothetical protein